MCFYLNELFNLGVNFSSRKLDQFYDWDNLESLKTY